MFRPACIASILVLSSCHSVLALEELSAEDVALFEEDILPIFEENCFKCHGEGDDLHSSTFLEDRKFTSRLTQRGPFGTQRGNWGGYRKRPASSLPNALFEAELSDKTVDRGCFRGIRILIDTNRCVMCW